MKQPSSKLAADSTASYRPIPLSTTIVAYNYLFIQIIVQSFMNLECRAPPFEGGVGRRAKPSSTTIISRKRRLAVRTRGASMDAAFTRCTQNSIPISISFPWASLVVRLNPMGKFFFEAQQQCGNEEIVEFVKEEKGRKQMEDIAEDLFNNEKVMNQRILGKENLANTLL